MNDLLTYSSDFLAHCVQISLGLLTISFLLILLRLVKGPSFPDRIVALDVLVTVAIGFIAAIGVQTSYYLYVDIAIALGLIGFLATVASARFLLNRGAAGDEAILDDVKTNENKTRKNY